MLQTKKSSKVLSISLVIALMITLFAGMTFSASAVGAPTPGTYWTDAGNYDDTWYNPGSSSFTLTNELQFAGLASLVNTGTADFSGKTVTLANNLDLSKFFWYPIGGVSPLSAGGVPTGYFFAGTFIGGNHTIDGLFIEYISKVSNNSGYGLFGYINGGSIQDFTIINGLSGGAVNLGNNDVSAVGAAVGYTNGNISNVHNKLDVTMTNTNASMLGGIAGTVENPGEGVITVYKCSNTGNLIGRGRIGGIVGAAYTKPLGGVVIDNCYNKGIDGAAGVAQPQLGNTIITVGTNRRSYAGGIVGYLQGYVTNSYAIVQLGTYGGHYQGGVAGIVQGESEGTPGGMSNCYSRATFLDSSDATPALPLVDPDPDYDKYLFASIDNSNTVPILNSLWVDTYATKDSDIDCYQVVGDGSNGWGDWQSTGFFGTGGVADTNTTDAWVYTTPSTIGSYADALGTLNAGTTLSVGKAYDPTAASGYYPLLDWE
jgi:hypothetical protein